MRFQPAAQRRIAEMVTDLRRLTNAASREGLARGELVEQRAGVQGLDVLERRDHGSPACAGA
jgi:hypothetical protein